MIGFLNQKKNFLNFCILILFCSLFLNFYIYYPFRITNETVASLANPDTEKGLLITGLTLLLVVLPSLALGSTFTIAILAINLLYFLAVYLFILKFVILQFPKLLIILFVLFLGFNPFLTIKLSEISVDSFSVVFLLFFLYVLWKIYDEIKFNKFSISSFVWFSLLFIFLSELETKNLIILSFFVLTLLLYSSLKKSLSIFRQFFLYSFTCFLIVQIINQSFIFFGLSSSNASPKPIVAIQMLNRVINKPDTNYSFQEYAKIHEIISAVTGSSSSSDINTENKLGFSTILPLTFAVCSKNLSTCIPKWIDQTRIIYLPTYSYQGNYLFGYEMNYNPAIFYVPNTQIQIDEDGNELYRIIYYKKIPGLLEQSFNFTNGDLTKFFYKLHAKLQLPIWFYFWYFLLTTLFFFIRRRFLYHSKFDIFIGSILAIVWASYIYFFVSFFSYNLAHFTSVITSFPLIFLLETTMLIVYIKKFIHQKNHLANRDIDNDHQNKVAKAK